jgi:hypothetical protein
MSPLGSIKWQLTYPNKGKTSAIFYCRVARRVLDKFCNRKVLCHLPLSVKFFLIQSIDLGQVLPSTADYFPFCQIILFVQIYFVSETEKMK